MDIKIGTQKKDDPADVAENGFRAMMAGDGGIVSGFHNKMRVAAATVQKHSPSSIRGWPPPEPQIPKERVRRHIRPSLKMLPGASAIYGIGRFSPRKHAGENGGQTRTIDSGWGGRPCRNARIRPVPANVIIVGESSF
jgi:hypothetical protein